MDNTQFFKNNVDFYSTDYKDYELRSWELKIANTVQGPEILDVACGGGRMTVPLLRRGHNVVGTDFIPEFEDKIREHEAEFKGQFGYLTTPMTKLPFADTVFDSVTCINSIIYLKNIEELRQAIGEMSRVLKPGGWLYITTWNILHPYWATSVILNHLLRRGKRFGEVSPFRTTDGRVKNSKTTMYVPTKKVLKHTLYDAGLTIPYTCTGPESVGDGSILSAFHPNLVVSGLKEEK